jgi:hypothetical protein
MVSMVVMAFGLLGVMASVQWSGAAVQAGATRTAALHLTEARLEAKRAAMWPALLSDDLDGDGIADIVMHDDGVGDDEAGGDGIYTASSDIAGIHLVWSVQPEGGMLAAAGSARIDARARYVSETGQHREIRLQTIRANPQFVGARGA